MDLDSSVDNHNDHNTMALLNIKKMADNTFEYEGGIGHIIEWLFHANLKSQLNWSIILDDPPITIIDDVVGQFILWPTKCLRHTLEA